MAENKLRLAVKEMRANGASEMKIYEVVTSALKEDASKENSPKTVLLRREQKREISKVTFTQVVTELLHEIRIPTNIKGYHYLRYAIMYSMEESEKDCRTKEKLYSVTAKRFGTTSSKVEFAIRYAIKVAYKCNDLDLLNKYLGYTMDTSRRKPTSLEFIAMISDKLRLEYELI